MRLLDQSHRLHAWVTRTAALWSRVYDAGSDDVPAWRPRRARDHAAALGGFCAFGTLLLWAQISRLDAIPDLGDPLFSVWRVSWVYRQLIGDPRSLFDANIFFPRGHTLAYSDAMLLPALMTAPLLAAGLHVVVATNVILVLTFVASAFAAYLLTERLTGSWCAGFVAGLIFGFYPYRFDHYIHFELLFTFCLPLILLALHLFLQTAALRCALLAAVFAIAQLYSSMYLAVLQLWQVIAMTIATLALYRPRLRPLVAPAILAAVVAAAAAWPLVHTYSSAGLEERTTTELALYSAEPRDYLQPHPRSAFWGRGSTPGPERALFPGIVPILLAAAAFTQRIGRLRLVYLAGLLFAFEMSLGANGVLYPGLYESFGFMRGLRAPARAGFLVGLCLSVLAGLGVHRLLRGRSRTTTAASVVGLTALLAVDLHPQLALTPAWPAPPAIYEAVRPTDVLAEFPMGSLTADTLLVADTPYMYFSTWHGAQLINGYSGHLPPDHFEFLSAMEEFPSPPALDILRRRGATHVTINCLFYKGCGRLLDRAARSRELEQIASTRWQGRWVRLYQLKNASGGALSVRR